MSPKSKRIMFFSIVGVSIIVITYFSIAPNFSANKVQNFATQQANQSGISEKKVASDNSSIDNKTEPTNPPQIEKTNSSAGQSNPSDIIVPKVTPKDIAKTNQGANAKTQDVAGVIIKKSDITGTAKFYPITVEGTYMEVLAVRASDGTIRTALNTCQVCYDSGRGYYVQQGNILVCQNCKNRFEIDQIGVEKGGCNPVPILEQNKIDNGSTILIPETYLSTQKELFANWKKQF